MSKTVGGVLLIVGTCIGAGILALPVTTSEVGFIGSSLLLLFSWVLMTFCAFLILEANLWFKEEPNMVSMAKATLGLPGQVLTWIIYLALLYSLLAVYISGGTDVLNDLLNEVQIPTPDWLDTLLFTGILGIIVYQGTHIIDYVNRGFMFVKLSAMVLLLILIFWHIEPQRLLTRHARELLTGLMVMFVSFGFATIVPSLRNYFHGDVKQLRRCILIGSLIPLCAYILWDLAVLGSLPMEGNNGLLAILHSGRITSRLMDALQYVIHKSAITALSHLFTSICVMTSFLGVSLCLVDFLADGLKMHKHGKNKIYLHALTFAPPFLLVLYYPSAFLEALDYAGIFTAVLLALLPVMIVWRGRYHLGQKGTYEVWGGKLSLLLSGFCSLGIVAVGILEIFPLYLKY